MAAASPAKDKTTAKSTDAGTSTQDAAEKPKRESDYTVLEKVALDDLDAFLDSDKVRDVTDVYVKIGTSRGRTDKDAIGRLIGDEDDGTFVGLSRFNERTPETKTRVSRSWR
jgi:hypothetical protein